ncbi:hypothetical protein AFSV47Ss_0170 [African swine fever virus]|uniref:Uncharacterized protein n=1 Tax=African swine fever virus TaxID=10497 RepID=A0A6G6AGN7_ASF|nr:hypothetical protein AFSV47Ss_0170 [African swine fever virus]
MFSFYTIYPVDNGHVFKFFKLGGHDRRNLQRVQAIGFCVGLNGRRMYRAIRRAQQGVHFGQRHHRARAARLIIVINGGAFSHVGRALAGAKVNPGGKICLLRFRQRLRVP